MGRTFWYGGCFTDARTTRRPGPTALARKIAQFRNDSSGERNLYPFVRDLLTNAAFGIGLKSDQVVARLFGMSEEDLNYITSARVNDGFLKQLRPSLEHRACASSRMQTIAKVTVMPEPSA